MSVGLVYTRLRQEENLLLEAAEREGIRAIPQHDSGLVLTLDGGIEGDAVLVRSLSATRGLMVARAAASWDRPTINRPETAATCMDKAETSLRLARAGVPTPQTRVAFEPASARRAAQDLGYPVVLKPVQGSWARLVSLARDEAELDQILEHRAMLPSPTQRIYYMQEYVDKTTPAPGAATATTASPDGTGTVQTTATDAARVHHDIRAFVVGDETIAAVRRTSPHWLTNTARGATTRGLAIDDAFDDVCQRAAQAVGGGALAIDLIDGPDGLLVHEVNHTMEFRNSIAPTGIDIPARILRYAVQEGRR